MWDFRLGIKDWNMGLALAIGLGLGIVPGNLYCGKGLVMMIGIRVQDFEFGVRDRRSGLLFGD